MSQQQVGRLIGATNDAFTHALHAVLDQDKHAARQVLRRSAHRRALVAAADEELRCTAVPPVRRGLFEGLQFVADLRCLGGLSDELARQVLGGTSSPLSRTERLRVDALLHAGQWRLEQLAGDPSSPDLDPGSRSCGETLFVVADDVTPSEAVTMHACAALAVTLLQATRHASRAA